MWRILKSVSTLGEKKHTETHRLTDSNILVPVYGHGSPLVQIHQGRKTSQLDISSSVPIWCVAVPHIIISMPKVYMYIVTTVVLPTIILHVSEL